MKPVDDAGVARSVDGGFDLLWERSGATVSFVLVPVDPPPAVELLPPWGQW